MSYSISVRALCDFAAKEGDLDFRFTPSPTAQQGLAGHGVIAARRAAIRGYRSELALAGRHKHLGVRGRADGYDVGRGRLEEVKTHRGALSRIPANHRVLHWAQLKVYGALLCRQDSLAALELSLVYFDVATQDETLLTEHHAAAELQSFFEALCERFVAWAAQELAHRSARDDALRALPFPHPSFRAGQRQLAAAVYRAATASAGLMAQAPTGIGKTVGTLFPLLKASPGERLDKIFFLTAKGSGRPLAFDAMALLQRGDPPLRTLELVSRDNACEHPDKACHGDACPLARGSYDRLPAARAMAVTTSTLDRAALRRIALDHQICPYYLGQEMARWADVVIADYNHYFDVSAALHGLAQAQEWRVGVLVDEAHNLVERARRMYSAELDVATLKRLCASALPPFAAPLKRLRDAWLDLATNQAEPYRSHAHPPQAFVAALQRCLSVINEQLAEAADTVSPDLLRFYFDALHLARLLEDFGDHSLFELQLTPSGSTIGLRNIVPAPFLKPRFSAATTTTLFSATLSPPAFFRDMLGLPESMAWVDVESPFTPGQLSVKLATHISTRWPHRQSSIEPLVDVIARQYAERPGNYLAFFSSFDYLQQVVDAFAVGHPEVPIWSQSPGMPATERERFLARFEADGRGIGFAVLGGSFGEGIDLPGERLIGAFVATLVLPPLNAVNEQMRERMQSTFGAGYDYTYLYPGLQKVVQAAGRVIRTPSDDGVIVLIDDRFARAEVQRLLPRWWPAAARFARPALSTVPIDKRADGG